MKKAYCVIVYDKRDRKRIYPLERAYESEDDASPEAVRLVDDVFTDRDDGWTLSECPEDKIPAWVRSELGL